MRQPVGLDGLLHLLGSLGVTGKVAVADEGGIGEVVRLVAVGLCRPTPRTKHSAVRDFAMTERAIHRGNYNVLEPRRYGNSRPVPLGNGMGASFLY